MTIVEIKPDAARNSADKTEAVVQRALDLEMGDGERLVDSPK